MRYVAVAAVVAALALGAPAMAQPTTTGSATAPTRGRMEFERAVGKLTKIDGKSLTVAMTENGTTKDVVVTCTDATRIIKSIRPANAAAAPVRGGRGPALRRSSRISRSARKCLRPTAPATTPPG